MIKKKDILESIKRHCIECMGYEELEVEKCMSKECNLYAYRLGR